jgi:hypothetical protein
MKRFLMILFAIAILSLTLFLACEPYYDEENEEEEVVTLEDDGPLIEILDDSYMNVSCMNPAWGNEPMNGWLRCESFAVVEEIAEDGSVVYQLNIDDCTTSLVGAGWVCEARLFHTHSILQ